MLETQALTARFGARIAVDRVSCAFGPGTLTAVVGEPGAGKTTYLRLISGQLAPAAGTVRLGGVDVTREAASTRAHRGLGRAFESPYLFPKLSVLENVRLAVQSRRRRGVDDASARVDRRGTLERARALLERTSLTAGAGTQAARLRPSDQRRLDVAMLMALAPSVYLFDEPTAGIDDAADATAVLDLIRGLKRDPSKTVLVAARDIDALRGLADRVVVLEQGRLVADEAAGAVGRAEPPGAGFGRVHPRVDLTPA